MGDCVRNDGLEVRTGFPLGQKLDVALGLLNVGSEVGCELGTKRSSTMGGAEGIRVM